MTEILINILLASGLVISQVLLLWKVLRLKKRVRDLEWETRKFTEPMIISSVNTETKDATGEYKPFDFIHLTHAVYMIIGHLGLAYFKGDGTHVVPDRLIKSKKTPKKPKG